MATVSNTQASLALQFTMSLDGFFPQREGDSDPQASSDYGYIGQIRMTAQFSEPADTTSGQVLNVSDHFPLFAVIGTTYGGDGRTTFNAPNFQGDVLIGAANGVRGTYTLGQQVGADTVEVQGSGATFSNYETSEPTRFLIATQGNFNVLAGELIRMAGPNATPDGYLAAEGQVLQISQYQTLFAAIGSTYGGNGTTTFALPDLRGRAVVGDSERLNLGDVLGSSTVTLTPATAPTSAGGAGEPFANSQPGLVLNYLVKLTGIYPIRGEAYAADDKFIGEIIVYAGSTIPSGYAVADGRLLNINQHSALYSLIGAAYGGNGTSNFALPDLRGRVAIDNGPDNPLGQRTGQVDLAAPVVTSPANGSVTDDTTPTISGTAEANRTVVVVVDGVNVGTTTSNAQGAWSFTVTSPLSQASHTFKAYISDGAGSRSQSSATQTAQIEIDDLPVFSGTAAVLAHGTEDTAYTVTKAQLLDGYSDPEGKALSVTGLTSSNGTVTANADGSYTITPAANFNGAVTLTYNVTDGTTTPVAATRGFVLDAINDAPVLAQPATAKVVENAASGTVVATLAATDVDDAGSALRYAITGGNAAGLFAIDAATGQVTVAAGKHLDYETARSHALTVVSTDAAGLQSAAKTLTIDVTNVNEATAITATPSVAGTLKAGDTVTFTLAAESAVAVSGAPTLTLNNGATASYAGLDASGAAKFLYTVVAGQDTSNLTVTGLNLNGGSLDAPGTLGFAAGTSVPVGPFPPMVTTADVNGDGKLDIVTVNASADQATVRLGDGLGGFTNAADVSVGSTPRSVTVADVNGDGKLDILTANYSANTVSVRLGDGAGGFSGTTDVSVRSNPYIVLTADVNGDGKLDLLASTAFNNVSVRLGDGLGGFSGTREVGVGGTPQAMTLADVNRDGFVDILTANSNANTVSVSLGNGAGGFGAATNLAVGAFPVGVKTADFNGDGKLDIVSSNLDGKSLSVLLGDGLGGFGAARTVALGGNPQGLAAADINGDGKTDLVAVVSSTSTVSVLLGDGAGGFGPSVNYNMGEAVRAVTVADVNGDGRPDLLVTTNGFNSAVKVLLNTPSAGLSFDPASVSSGAAGAATGRIVDTIAPALTGAQTALAGTEDQAFTVTRAQLVDGWTDAGSVMLSVSNLTLAGGRVVDNGDGTFTVTPPANANGPVTLSYRVGDGVNFTAATRTVTLEAVNDAPTVANTLIATAAEGDGALTFDLLAGASDVDSGETATLSVTGVSYTVNGRPSGLPAGVTLTGATLTVDTNDAAYDELKANQSVVIKVSYLVTDAHGATFPQSQTIGLFGTNDGPVLAQPATVSIAEDAAPGAAIATLVASDVDDAASALRYSIVSGSGSDLFAIDAVTGAVTLAAGKSLDFESAPSHTLTVRATDAAGLFSDKLLTIDVIDVNEAPVLATGLADQSFERGDISFQVPAGAFTDTDGDTLVYSAKLADGEPLPGWLTFDPATRTFSGRPAASDVGIELTVQVTASDGAFSVSDVFELTIAPKVVDTDAGANRELAISTAGLADIDTIETSDGSVPVVRLTDAGSVDLSGKLSGGVAVTASNAGNRIVTGAFADTLTGGDGADRLDGGAGKDTMAGGKGADIYYVDDLGDTVGEIAGEGADIVYASVDWTMTAGSAIEQLRANYGAATAGLTLIGNALNNLIMGGAADDVLDGGAGNDRLIGGLGADKLSGGVGDDSYYVDDAADQVFELADEGADVVYASVGWTLTAGAHVEQLRANYGTAATGISLTGNALDNFILGGAKADTLDGGDGADRLDGGLGADTMIGGKGSDSFYVDNAGDVVTEKAGDAGVDVVYASVSWTLTEGAHVEELRANYGSATTGITLRGNDLANKIFGGGADDVIYGGGGGDRLDGGLGADTMYGGDGNDTFYVDEALDQAIEIAGQGTDTVFASVDWTITEGSSIEMLRASNGDGLRLTGNGLANSIFGAAGKDTLDGGLGADILTGNLGADTFVFSSALGSGNVDRIVDFSSMQGDRLQLSSFAFVGLEPSFKTPLDPDLFVANLSGKAETLEQRIVYETDTGKLFYDADGLGGAAGTHFATLYNKTTISADDIFVV